MLRRWDLWELRLRCIAVLLAFTSGFRVGIGRVDGLVLVFAATSDCRLCMMKRSTGHAMVSLDEFINTIIYIKILGFSEVAKMEFVLLLFRNSVRSSLAVILSTRIRLLFLFYRRSWRKRYTERCREQQEIGLR